MFYGGGGGGHFGHPLNFESKCDCRLKLKYSAWEKAKSSMLGILQGKYGYQPSSSEGIAAFICDLILNLICELKHADGEKAQIWKMLQARYGYCS